MRRLTAQLVWLETPTNPLLTVYDITAIAQVCRKKGVLLAVDNTFMTPYFQQPLKLGADLVVHSLTKYIGGHADLCMGFVATNSAELAQKLQFYQLSLGAVPAPFDCYICLLYTSPSPRDS